MNYSHSIYPNSFENTNDLRTQKSFSFSVPQDIPIQNYKNLGYAMKDAYNPPSIQTYYPPAQPEVKPRLSEFPIYRSSSFTPFSFNS